MSIDHRSLTILLLLSGLALSGCDAPPAPPQDPSAPGGPAQGGPGAAGPDGQQEAAVPPDGFRSLLVGPRFLETTWGPDISAEQVPTFRTLTIDAVLREDKLETAVREEEVRLTQALIDKVSGPALEERINAFVAVERTLVEEQISTTLTFYDVFTVDQMATRLRRGQPPVLVELLNGHPLTSASNPFARTDTRHLAAPEIEEVLRRKLDVHAQYLVYQKALAEPIAAVGRLDLTQPKWGEAYTDITQDALDLWETYRRHAVGGFINFLATLPSDRRNKFLLADGLAEVLKPADPRFGVAAGTPPATEGAASSEGATSPNDPTASGAPGGPPGGPGGPGAGGPPGGPGGPMGMGGPGGPPPGGPNGGPGPNGAPGGPPPTGG